MEKDDSACPSVDQLRTRLQKAEDCNQLFLDGYAPGPDWYRITAMVSKCRKRNGDCPCLNQCEAEKLIDKAMQKMDQYKKNIDLKQRRYENLKLMINTPVATLKKDFKFREGLTPVMYFDTDEAHFGYVDQDGEWVEDCEEWPFEENYVWPDDCVKNGIQPE